METHEVLKETTAVRPPVQEPLPGVFASLALETVYYIRCADRAVLVDTGFFHNADAHLANFESAGLSLKCVDAILTTHYHVDHNGGLAHVRQRLGCPVVTHKNSVAAIQEGDRIITAAEMPFLQGWSFPYTGCPVDEVVEAGDKLVAGSTTFTVFHLPGHTPGCTGYHWEGNLISGDVVFPGGTLGWYDVHWGSNYLDTCDAMKRIEDLAPKCLLPSHLLPFAYEPSVAQNASTAAQAMMEGNKGGPVCFTCRAPLRDAAAVPRTIHLRPHR
jgi:glyoxylase-like metal-dependent hydrolase (beta-lactamase superfamily II)